MRLGALFLQPFIFEDGAWNIALDRIFWRDKFVFFWFLLFHSGFVFGAKWMCCWRGVSIVGVDLNLVYGHDFVIPFDFVVPFLSVLIEFEWFSRLCMCHTDCFL